MRRYLPAVTILLCTAACVVAMVPDTAQLPQIPASGWTADEGPYRSWSQETVEGRWQIADYNSDGVVDYVRYQVPRDSYRHRIWVDSDYDGYFDDYSGADADHTSGQRLEIHLPVPAFEPAGRRT